MQARGRIINIFRTMLTQSRQQPRLS